MMRKQYREVPFHRPAIGVEEESEVLEALRSGWLTTGPRAKRFEQEFARYVGARHAVAVAHGTGALHLALWAVGIGPGDEVITTPFTFTATAEVLVYLGARAIFVDIEPDTLNIDPAAIEQALAKARVDGRRIKAIEPVHFAGHPCDMNQICALARRDGLWVVEDAAHAAGAEYHVEGRGMVRIGSVGHLSCFSFYATKNFTSGEGGMVTTEDERLAEKIAVASLHGMDRNAWKRYSASGSWFYEIHDMGFKYNLSDLHAALGLAQLRRADALMRRRQEIARAYSEAFRDEDALELPVSRPDVVHPWHLYVIRLRDGVLRVDRDRFLEELRARGVGASVHFIPLNRMPFYQKIWGYRSGDFPVAEDAFRRCLSLPIYPAMTTEDVDYVADTVLELVRRNRR